MSALQQVSAEPITMKPGEVLNVGIDFTRYGLTSSETLTGTPVVTPGTGVTAGSPSVNAATFVNRAGGTVAIGKGVQVTLTAGSTAGDVDVLVSCGTSGSQTLKGNCPVRIRTR